MALSMMQKMNIWESGKCRCTHCGKFRKESDFPDQPASISVNEKSFVVIIHVAPVCIYCMNKY